ncbi:Homeodomain-like domain-containing protein [Isoptericola jiangsuensis]|uniref:Homeodomain-like domain-containing protein n=1 Tax=Isoptericola jiangsuensis TaxID=548579 RepID=A0A2A9EW26_9MICO|nr:helix-turn-helix domain-containing protein [Isoptericola jiangsuensis]PFG42359.1 Homeodomain-like domain-containing protein [Isoptericola jiangsuensis]
MTQQDRAATSGSPRQVRYRGRHLPMIAVVVAATIATALAYRGMVLFGLEVAHMTPVEAYGMAGFLEVSLVAVALMARNAALEGRPYGVLLTLTWVLSGTSGVFAALHEVAVPTESTPYMVVFRFVPPLVAALMWHLALVGERHMVTGHTLDERRRESRVHQYVTALEQWRDARVDSSGSASDLRKVRAAHQNQRAARDGALKLLTVEDFERRMQVWVERLEAAERHGNRLDLIGASSVKRGTARGPLSPADAAAAERQSAPVPVAEARELTALVTESARDAAPARPAEAPAVAATTTAPGVADDDQPYVPDTAFEDLEFGASVRKALGNRDSLPWDQPAPEDAAAPAVEPPTATGHTRRVEVFDLVQRGAAAEQAQAAVETAGATADDDPTAERDRRIVDLSRQGYNQREIAEQVDVSRSVVSRVVRRYKDQQPAGDEDRQLVDA